MGFLIAFNSINRPLYDLKLHTSLAHQRLMIAESLMTAGRYQSRQAFHIRRNVGAGTEF
jgi:hypothetical protein